MNTIKFKFKNYEVDLYSETLDSEKLKKTFNALMNYLKNRSFQKLCNVELVENDNGKFVDFDLLNNDGLIENMFINVEDNLINYKVSKS